MPRIRSIKPEFFTSEVVAELTYRQRLTWVGLWTHVDDSGRCRDNPRLIKAAVWPLEDVTAGEVDDDLVALGKAGRLQRYTVDGLRYLEITNWQEHQHPNRPQQSKLPPPPPHGPDGPGGASAPFTEPSVSTHGACSDGAQQTLPEINNAITEASALDRLADLTRVDRSQPSSPGRPSASSQVRPRSEQAVNTHGGLTPGVVVGEGEGEGEGSCAARATAAAAIDAQLPPGIAPRDRERLITHAAAALDAGAAPSALDSAIHAWLDRPDATPGLLPNLIGDAVRRARRPASARPGADTKTAGWADVRDELAARHAAGADIVQLPRSAG